MGDNKQFLLADEYRLCRPEVFIQVREAHLKQGSTLCGVGEVGDRIS